MSDYRYPDNILVARAPTVQQFERLSDVGHKGITQYVFTKIDDTTQRRDIVAILAAEQLMQIGEKDLFDMLKQRKDQVCVVDCRAAKLASSDTPYRIASAIRFDMTLDATEQAFQKMVNDPGKYNAKTLFSEKDGDLPQAVVFYCQQGMSHSPWAGFWYAKYLLRRLELKLEPLGVSPQMPRIYVLEKGIGGMISEQVKTALLIDDNDKAYKPTGHAGNYLTKASSDTPSTQRNAIKH